MTASEPCDINMGSFTRLAQAAHLLDQVFRHTNDHTMSPDAREEEAFELDKALRALVALTASDVGQENFAIRSDIALCQRLVLSCAALGENWTHWLTRH